MNTPIVDFVRAYAEKQGRRFHMPGHKGLGPLGVEALDITEIDGADSLYEASGIIAESEENASRLLGCPTFYSTEGSSLAIRAMLYLAMSVNGQGARYKVLAGRNAHKTFLSAAALLDLDVSWLYPQPGESYHSCTVTPEALEQAILKEKPDAVYLTSPDYLGSVADISDLARVCHDHEALLLVDNAHGAYLKFLEPSLHPMDLGADLCADSAHKTLPVLTGGAYLHVSNRLFASKEACRLQAKAALALFGSTSPSYLILQSLDAANRYLETCKEKLAAFLPAVEALKKGLKAQGFRLMGREPLKVTLNLKPYGYTGDAFSRRLAEQGVFTEFHDPDFVVLMLTPENGDLGPVLDIFKAIPPKDPLPEVRFESLQPVKKMSVREAVMAPHVFLPADQCEGRVLAQATVGCPPAVPILMSGEEVSVEALERFRYYGVQTLCVVENDRK